MKQMTMTHSLISIALATSASLGVAAGQDAESALANADAYTVVVKTIIRQPFGEESKGRSMGAGFLIDLKRGWILTNAHVASRSQASITAKFRSSDPMPARRVYVDPFIDLAILSIPPEKIPQGSQEARLDCGELPKSGVPVVAYGHPGGLYFTGTKGIISGVSAKYEMELLQTDASINRGNSGGPLINLSSGQVAGISTASVSGLKNVNFALASRFACPIIDLLKEGKNPSPPKADWVFYSGTEETSILKVAKAGDFGKKLGVKPGDVILSISGSPKPTNETQLMHYMRGKLGDMRVDVERDGRILSLHAATEAEPDILAQEALLSAGMLMTAFDPRLVQDIRLEGVMVNNVDKGSAAELADISSGTMLVSVNGIPTPSLEAAFQALTSASSTENESILVFKRFGDNLSPMNGSLFAWRERKVVIGDVKRIRAGEGDAVMQ